MSTVKDNYYDISIKSAKKPNKAIIHPRRINSQSSISDLAAPINSKDNKRPGDYYIQKLSSSCLNLSNGKRPISGDSILSLNSTYSDEISLNSLNDNHGSRLSSMTSTSISPNESPTLSSVGQKSHLPNKPRKFVLEDTCVSSENLNQSLSTITSENVHHDVHQGMDSSMNSVCSLNSTASNFTSLSTSSLTRTKTKYLSQEEIKNRQKLRKKQYDDSYNEDEILPNDISLVFNVPVIKSSSELYVQKKFRHNLIDDNNYKPFPLPGKLRSNSSPNIKTIGSFDTTIEKVDEEREDEDEDQEIDDVHQSTKFSVLENDSSDSFDNDDSEIIQNLSNYYNERSKSYSKLAQISRHEAMMYKLPSYIKSQSSIDDLQFISPEKLSYVDQTRPINLPPKTEEDKVKHNKELQKMFKDFEKVSTSDYPVSRASLESDDSTNSWKELIDSDNFNRKLVQEKNMIRKFNWDSNCIESERFNYFMKLLNFHGDKTQKIEENYHKLVHVYEHLNQSIKTNRHMEFEKTISTTLKRPIISSNVKDIGSFKRDYTLLLFLKSIDNSLHKHDETFMIPIILALFPSRSLLDRFKLIELMDSEIFNKDLIMTMNGDFSDWSSKLPKKVSKYLTNFNLKEFDSLSFNKFFEVLLQFNDKLPLSISANNGPIATSPVSCSLEVVFKFLQLLAVYNINSKTRLLNHKKIFDSLLVVVIKYYHINWLDINELVEDNKSIKLNFNINNVVNSNNFFDKWSTVFRAI